MPHQSSSKIYFKDNEYNRCRSAGHGSLTENTHYNQISDISALAGLTELTTLNLNNNEISEISVLSELTTLTGLYLLNNPLDNEAITTHIPNLKSNNPKANIDYGPIYSLDISSGDNGTITSPGEGTFQYGEGYSVSVEISPDQGYSVSEWSGTDDDSSSSRNNSVLMDTDKTVTVTFEPDIDANLNVTPNSQPVDFDSGSTSFSVINSGEGTMDWTALVTSGDSWLSITSGSNGSNDGTINVSYLANTETSVRTGTIQITSSNASGSPKEVTVTQAAYVPKVDTPIISPNGGTFTESTSVSLSSTTPDATIRYTTDGTTPGASSDLYTAPFTIDTSVTVKALAFKTDYLDSDVASASFIITEEEIPELSITPGSQTVNAATGTTSFAVGNIGTGTLTWTASMTSGDTWFLITSGSSGTDAGTIDVAYLANESATSRTATIRVTGTDAINSPIDITVVQERECNLSDAIIFLQILTGQSPDFDSVTCSEIISSDGRIDMEEIFSIMNKFAGVSGGE